MDFSVLVGPGSGGTYPVSLLSSPSGEASGAMTLKLTDWQDTLDIVANARGGGGSRGAGTAMAADPIGLSTTREMGRKLFQSLMIPEIQSLYQTSYRMSVSQGKGLRIRLRIQAPELAVLPWEYLVDSSGERLTLSSNTPVVRHLEIDIPNVGEKLKPPVQVLGMVGFHKGLDPDAEKALIERATQKLRDNGKIRLDWAPGHTWRDLQAALGNGTYHVFHFIGHGEFDPQARVGKLLLEAEGAPDTPSPLDAETLGRMLFDHQSLRLVVLNSCEGAKASDTSLFSSTASIVAKKGIPAVISMQYEISDDAAIEFARTFYEFLSLGMPVEAAVAEARQSIELAARGRSVETVEWGTPVLHLRPGDGLLFELNLNAALDLRAAPTAVTPVALAAPAQVSERGLQILAGRVNKNWIVSVLQKKLEFDIHLGLDRISGQVDDPLGGDSVDTPQGSESLGERSATDVFQECGKCLLILGDPGSGKTVELLKLAQDLLGLWDASQPVPVVFPLSAWVPGDGGFSEWLAGRLFETYQIPKATGRGWLNEGRILPLLDGLDEVAPGVRPACVSAINDWILEGQPGVALTCRFKEYDELPAKLAMNAAIRLQEMTRDQVFAFLERGGAQLAALRALLEGDSEMLDMARTPLMLGVMAKAYQGLDPKTVCVTPTADLAARRWKVFDAFARRAFRGVNGASLA